MLLVSLLLATFAAGTFSSVRWRGPQLVIETSREPNVSDGLGSRSVHTEAWSLDEQRGLVITITDTRPGANPTTRTLS